MSHPYFSFLHASNAAHGNIELRELSPGLNVIYGDNEAGKTRTKSFIEWMMYADADQYANATKKAKETAWSELPNELTGRYHLNIDDNEIAVNLRFNNGETSSNCESRQYSTSDISHILNDGVSREHFRHVFSLSLDELSIAQSKELMTQDKLAEEFLSASQTVSGVSYSKFVSTLKEKQQSYFKDSGNASNPIINKLIKDIKELDKQISILRNDDNAISNFENEIAEKSLLVDEIKNKISDLNSALLKNHTIQDNRDNYDQYLALENEPVIAAHASLSNKCGEIAVLETSCEDLITVEKEVQTLETEVSNLSDKVDEQRALLAKTLDPERITDYVHTAEFKSSINHYRNQITQIRDEIKRLQIDNHNHSKDLSLTLGLAENLEAQVQDQAESVETKPLFKESRKSNKLPTIGFLLAATMLTVFATIATQNMLFSLLVPSISGLIYASASLFRSNSKQTEHPIDTQPQSQAQPHAINTNLTEYQLKIEHYQTSISEIMNKISEQEALLATKQFDLENILDKAGFPKDTSVDKLDFYLADYDRFSRDLDSLSSKIALLSSGTERIKSVLDKIEALRPFATDTPYEITSPLTTINESLTWVSSLNEFAQSQKVLLDRALEKEAKQKQLEKILIQTFSSIDQATQIFTSITPSQLDVENEELKNQIVENEKTRTELDQEIGGLSTRLKIASNSNELADAMLKRQQLLDELSNADKTYKNISIALSVADEAAQYFMRENQPVVLNLASQLLSRATNSKWSHIEIAMNEKSKGIEPIINVSNFDHSITIDAVNLSRGAQEQLYLCLRLAVMKTYKKGKQIPVLFDDIAVNADRTRFEALAPIIGEMGQNRQVFYFTCHETTRDILKNSANARIINI